MKLMPFGCLLALFVMTVSPNVAVASHLTFFDGDFLSENWTPLVYVRNDPLTGGLGPLTSVGSVVRQANGGYPDAYLRSGHIVNLGDTINTVGIYIGDTYDPSERALVSVDFSYSVNHFNSDADTSTGVLPALLQDGQLFLGPIQLFDGDQWVPLSQNNLVADDFIATDSWFTGEIIHPDFSAFGETLQFGYSLQNRVAIGTTFTAIRGIDNWSVTFDQAAMSDIDGDGVNGTDLAIWSAGLGIDADAQLKDGDFDRNGRVDGADFLKWQRELGTLGESLAATAPEPMSLTLFTLAGVLLAGRWAALRSR